MTGFQNDTFTAFEVPTTSKWNKLWENLLLFYNWITNNESGWISGYVTWTYASATTFTISGDYSAIFEVGDKIRLKQGGAYKYFWITAVAYAAGTTTITITGGNTYTLTNATITDNYFAKVSTPDGFPVAMTWAPTHTGFSVNPSPGLYFYINGRTCTCGYNTSSGTSNGTGYTVSAPVTASAAGVVSHSNCQAVDNGALQTNPGLVQIAPSQTTFSLFKTWAGGAWTGSGTKYANFTISYMI